MTLSLPILILPTWMYHATQGGKIFHTREEIEEAEAQGWRDSPAAALAAQADPLPEIKVPNVGFEIEASLKIDHPPGDLQGKAVTKKRKR